LNVAPPKTRGFVEDITVGRNDRTKDSGRYFVWPFFGCMLAAIAYHVGEQYSGNTYSVPMIMAQIPSTAPQVPKAPASGAVNPENRASPQGPTGPIETKTGGAPASSPQGDTPAGMQAAPQGSAEKIPSPSK
jgi:hypothetical protein